MMDMDIAGWLIMLAAAGGAGLGYGFGYRRGQWAELGSRPEPRDPHVALCSCGHGSGKHERATGSCVGGDFRKRATFQPGVGESWWDEWVVCACESYDGPDPDTLRLLRGA